MRVFKILDHDYAALMRELKAAGLVTLHTAAPERKPGGFFKRKSSTKITVYLLIEPPDSPPAPTAPATPTP